MELLAVVRVLTTGTLLVIVGYLLRAGNWVLLTAEDPVGDKRRAVEFINHYVFFYSLLVSGIVCGAMFLLEVRRLIRGEQSVDESASCRVVVT
jgi:TRAP-type C4-dicarboxylate transport system permease small subunit